MENEDVVIEEHYDIVGNFDIKEDFQTQSEKNAIRLWLKDLGRYGFILDWYGYFVRGLSPETAWEESKLNSRQQKKEVDNENSKTKKTKKFDKTKSISKTVVEGKYSKWTFRSS
jgi:hypothetical protein